MCAIISHIKELRPIPTHPFWHNGCYKRVYNQPILAPILVPIAINQVHSSHPYQQSIHQNGNQRVINHPSGYGASAYQDFVSFFFCFFLFLYRRGSAIIFAVLPLLSCLGLLGHLLWGGRPNVQFRCWHYQDSNPNSCNLNNKYQRLNYVGHPDPTS